MTQTIVARPKGTKPMKFHFPLNEGFTLEVFKSWIHEQGRVFILTSIEVDTCKGEGSMTFSPGVSFIVVDEGEV